MKKIEFDFHSDKDLILCNEELSHIRKYRDKVEIIIINDYYGVSSDIIKVFYEFKKLKILNVNTIDYQTIQRILNILPNLETLEEIQLIYNDKKSEHKYVEIPSLKNLQQLKILDLSINCIVFKSNHFFRDLSSLEKLRISDWESTSLPNNIFDGLFRLLHLCIEMPRLSFLPKSIKFLELLRSLVVCSREIIFFPEEIKYLQELRSLSLNITPYSYFQGRIKQIPNEILKLEKLEEINTYGMNETNFELFYSELSNLKRIKNS